MIDEALNQFFNGQHDLLRQLVARDSISERDRNRYGYRIAVAAAEAHDISLYALVASKNYPIWTSFSDILDLEDDAVVFEMYSIWRAKVNDINGILDNDNTRPLILASAKKKPYVLEDLLKIGADPNLVDKHQQSALFMAVCSDDTRCVQLLIEVSNTDQVMDAYIQALRTARQDVVDIFLSKSIDHLSVYDGVSPLALAAKRGEEFFSSLTDKMSSDNKTRALFNIDRLDPGLLKILIDSGADVDAIDENLNTPLDLAKQCGDINKVRLLWSYSSIESRKLANLKTSP